MIQKVCSHCGSEAVWTEASAYWDEDHQEWVLFDIVPLEWCEDCETETSIVDKELVT